MLNIIKNPEKRYKIWSNAEKRMTKYDWNSAEEAIELTTAFKNLWKARPKDWFNSVIQVPFENTTINLPVEYEKYLRQSFGDYMKLPPVEQQHPRHNTVFVDMSNSYKIYKGKYYLKSQIKEKVYDRKKESRWLGISSAFT